VDYAVQDGMDEIVASVHYPVKYAPLTEEEQEEMEKAAGVKGKGKGKGKGQEKGKGKGKGKGGEENDYKDIFSTVLRNQYKRSKLQEEEMQKNKEAGAEASMNKSKSVLNALIHINRKTLKSEGVRVEEEEDNDVDDVEVRSKARERLGEENEGEEEEGLDAEEEEEEENELVNVNDSEDDGDCEE
jgi:hypothetical protein